MSVKHSYTQILFCLYNYKGKMCSIFTPQHIFVFIFILQNLCSSRRIPFEINFTFSAIVNFWAFILFIDFFKVVLLNVFFLFINFKYHIFIHVTSLFPLFLNLSSLTLALLSVCNIC